MNNGLKNLHELTLLIDIFAIKYMNLLIEFCKTFYQMDQMDQMEIFDYKKCKKI